MPLNLKGIKTSFAGGELAPALRSRVDLAKYGIGVSTLRNFIVHPHGGISNRPGFEYIASGKTSGKKVRLIPFEFSTEQNYVLEFGEYYCRFYSDGEQIYDDTSYDSYTKLMTHLNASPFTDEIGKTISNSTQYDSYTKSMLHFDGTDESTTITDEIGKTWTAQGNAQIDTAQKVFGTASLLLDGTGDYVDTVDHADFNFGTGEYAIEMRVRFNTVQTCGFYMQYDDGDNSIRWYYEDSGHTLNFIVRSGAAELLNSSYAWTPLADTWYHIVVSRSGNSLNMFIDGTLVKTIDATGVTMPDLTGNVEIGRYYSAPDSSYIDGWVDEARITKGVSRWTTDFTLPSVAYGTAVALDTGTKKFGAGSAEFYGVDRYLYCADSVDWSFGAGNFSIDFWVNFSSLDYKQGFVGQYQDSDNYWFIGKNADDTLFMVFKYAGTILGYYTTSTAPTFAASTWYHLEFTRSGSNAFMFVDGTSQNLTATVSFGSSNVGDITGTLDIGYDILDGAFFTGNLDELRISKGVARHTANFTVETSEYSAGTVLEVVTPYAEADLPYIEYTQSADVLYLVHPDYEPYQLERIANTEWELNAYAFEGGPFQLANVDDTKTIDASAVTGSGITLTATGFTFNSLHVGALYQLTHYIEAQAVTATLDEVEASSSIKCGGTWRIISHGTWTATIRVEKSVDGGSTWTCLREFSSADDFNVDTYGTEDMSGNAEPFLVRVNCTAHTSGNCNVNLTADAFYQNGIAEITAVAVGGATATADVVRTIGSTDATVDWNEGSWSDYAGWPSVVEFDPDDRLVFGNTYTEPSTYWMTQPNDYTNFSRSTPLVDSDAISSRIPSRKVNGINGLIPLSELIALTLSNEASIRSSSGAITPTTAYNKIHGWEGSYGIKPVVIGNRAVYVQSAGSILRDLGYNLYSDSFEGDELTIFSKHLFENHTVVDMAFQQNPNRLLWVVRDDGILLSMTYMREQDVVAWSWHDTNGGDDTFESVATIRGDGYDEVWVSVNRDSERCIERLKNRIESSDLEDQFFVDSGYTYDSTSTTSITGLTWLASKEVSVLADGEVVSGKTVSAGGVLTLDTAASVVQVGIGYYSDVETLNIDVNLQDGTVQGRKVKTSQIMFRLQDSQGGYIGPDSDTLFALQYEKNTGYDSTELFTGELPATLASGFSEGGHIFFRQSDPLPVTILAIIPDIAIAKGFTQVR